ncbi:MAG: DUF2089 domain-containing protein [Chloroflexota bacterium]|nr:DUF2089 domain-containing protein [Chloroflexota bacterium]
MARKILEQCPGCGGPLTVTELHCDRCDTQVRGRYQPSLFDSLTEEQTTFLRIFVTSRGNLSEVEKRLGISYPTVRAKLDEIIERLHSAERPPEARPEDRGGIHAAVRAAMPPDLGPLIGSAVREAMQNLGPVMRHSPDRGPQPAPPEEPAQPTYTTRREILEAISRGELSAAEGMARIQALGGQAGT